MIAMFLDRSKYIPHMIAYYGDKLIYFILISVVIYFIAFKIAKINRALWSYLGVKEIINICLSVIISNFICIIIYDCLFPRTFSNLRFSLFAPMSIIAGMMFVRILYRAIQETSKLKRNRMGYKNTLIIGAGDAGYLLLKELNKNNRFKANLVGLVDDKRTNTTISGLRVLGTTEDLKEIIEKYLKKLYILELELKKVHVMELTEEIEMGKGR